MTLSSTVSYSTNKRGSLKASRVRSASTLAQEHGQPYFTDIGRYVCVYRYTTVPNAVGRGAVTRTWVVGRCSSMNGHDAYLRVTMAPAVAA